MDALKEKYVGQYLGPNKIVDIAVLSEEVPMTLELKVEKHVNNKTIFEKHVLSEDAVAVYVTPESSDYTKLFEAKVDVIVPLMVAILAKYSIDFTEIDLIADKFKQQVKLHFNRATSLAFTGDDSRFIPGWDPMNDVSFAQAMFMISKAAPKDDAEG